MPNPKRKHTRSRRDSRRSANWKLELGQHSVCAQCGGHHPPHRICPHCGFYKGTLVLPKKEKKSKKGGQEGGGEAAS